MKKFNENLTAEKDLNIRYDLALSLEKALPFNVRSDKIIGNSLADIKRFVQRTEISFGLRIELNLSTPLKISQQLISIDVNIKDIFGEYKESVVLGDTNFTETGDKRVRLINVEYWFDLNKIKQSNIFKSLYNIDKFNL